MAPACRAIKRRAHRGRIIGAPARRDVAVGADQVGRAGPAVVAPPGEAVAGNGHRGHAGLHGPDIIAVAHTGDAEADLNNTARARTSHIYTVTHGGGGGWGGGGWGSSRAATTRGVMPYTAPAPTAHVTINTAVIGDRYDVQRVVTRALRGSLRLAGARS